eukprot:GHVH01012761.1.p1 GENE.GHVH01012761.1~~GHVH01012761.1.p1  ORF type:complete len:207 (-),score=40.01 GHVH01012761.1:318-938(-)
MDQILEQFFHERFNRASSIDIAGQTLEVGVTTNGTALANNMTGTISNLNEATSISPLRSSNDCVACDHESTQGPLILDDIHRGFSHIMTTMVDPLMSSIKRAGDNFLWWLELPEEEDPFIQWIERPPPQQVTVGAEDSFLRRLTYLDQALDEMDTIEEFHSFFEASEDGGDDLIQLDRLHELRDRLERRVNELEELDADRTTNARE